MLVTDAMNAYVKFANDTGNGLVQLKGGKAKKGVYNVKRVNSYHNRLRKFMGRFNGVVIKYLSNYLVLNNFVNCARETEDEKKDVMFRFMLSDVKSVECGKISKRNPPPVVAQIVLV